MTGIPWHREGMYREEGDPRRYKGRCKYYSYEKGLCTYENFRCPGSAHCDHYEEISEEEFKKRQNSRQKRSPKSNSDDEVYWF